MNRQIIVCNIVIALVLLSVGCVINHPQDSGSSQSSVSVSSEAPRQLITNRYQLVPGSFSVAPGRFYSAQFNVSGSGRVVGQFRSSSDITVAIVDEEGYRSIMN